jgi:hypothetical protein
MSISNQYVHFTISFSYGDAALKECHCQCWDWWIRSNATVQFGLHSTGTISCTVYSQGTTIFASISEIMVLLPCSQWKAHNCSNNNLKTHRPAMRVSGPNVLLTWTHLFLTGSHQKSYFLSQQCKITVAWPTAYWQLWETLQFLIKKFPGEKGSETVSCWNATARSFITEFRGEVFPHFHTVTVKHHSSMQNGLFGPPWWILCTIPLMSKKMMSMFLTLLFTSLGEFGLCVYASCFLPQTLV